VTKIRSENTVSYDMTRQMVKQPQALMIAASMVGIFSLVPGFPKVPFLLIAGCWVSSGGERKNRRVWRSGRKRPNRRAGKRFGRGSCGRTSAGGCAVDSGGCSPDQSGGSRRQSSVFERIGALRKKIAQKLGFILPLVRLRDDINLDPSAYEIRLYDHVIAGGKIEPDKYLAMDSGPCRRPCAGSPRGSRCTAAGAVDPGV